MCGENASALIGTTEVRQEAAEIAAPSAGPHEWAHLRISSSGLSRSSAIGSSRTHHGAKQTHGRAKSPQSPKAMHGLGEISQSVAWAPVSVSYRPQIEGFSHDREHGGHPTRSCCRPRTHTEVICANALLPSNRALHSLCRDAHRRGSPSTPFPILSFITALMELGCG